MIQQECTGWITRSIPTILINRIRPKSIIKHIAIQSISIIILMIPIPHHHIPISRLTTLTAAGIPALKAAAAMEEEVMAAAEMAVVAENKFNIASIAHLL